MKLFAIYTIVLLFAIVFSCVTVNEGFTGDLPVSKNQRCGEKYGTKCKPTQCCSRWSWCGPAGTDHCKYPAADQYQGDPAPVPTSGNTNNLSQINPKKYNKRRHLRTFVDGPTGGSSTNPTGFGDTLPSGSVLTNDQLLTSKNGLVTFKMQSDGNLVLSQSGKALWSSNTAGVGSGPYTLAMQTDGNLVLYDANTVARWDSKTGGQGQAPWRLTMQNDGNAVVYDSTNKALWSSNTIAVTSGTAPSLQAALPSKPIQLAKAPNMCLDVKDISRDNGALIQSWTCTGAANQSWGYQPNSQQFKDDNSGRCLDLPNGDQGNGQQLQIYDCWDTPNQKWEIIQNNILRKPGTNKCVDIANGSTDQGAKVQLYDCNSSDAQKYLMTSRPLQATKANNMCLDVPGAGTTDGTKVDLWSCLGNVNQSWSYNGATQQLRDDNSGKCLDLDGGNLANGTSIQLWTCDQNNPNQKFEFTNGFVRKPGTTKCLDIANGDFTNGTQVHLWDCNGADAQKWSFA